MIANNWSNTGCYVSCYPDKQSKESIWDFIKFAKIPNPVEKSKLHCTIVHSLTGAHFKAKPHCDIRVNGGILEVWELPDKGFGHKFALVLKLKSPQLCDRYHELSLHGLQCQYDEFIPHITLSMDVPRHILNRLPKFVRPIRFVREEVKECLGNV